MGMDHRIGYVKAGYDADVVVWDSHPLQLSATPKQVWIDGIAQLGDKAYVVEKPPRLHQEPKTLTWDKEAKETLDYEGLPPLETEKLKVEAEERIVFVNAKSVWGRRGGKVVDLSEGAANVRSTEGYVVVMQEGRISCIGSNETCVHAMDRGVKQVDLKGGSIA